MLYLITDNTDLVIKLVAEENNTYLYNSTSPIFKSIFIMSLDFSNIIADDVISAKPKHFSFLKSLGVDDSVVNKLSLNLTSIYSGSENVYLTPIGKDNNIDELIGFVTSMLESNSSKISSNLLKLEQSNLSKMGPRSIAKPWLDRKESLYDYFEHQTDPQNLKLSFSSPKINLRPVSVSEGIKYLKPNTNSGLPFYTRKSKIIDDLKNDFNKLILREDPCVLFTRTQEGGKTRNVWGYPVADTLNEMLFYQPLLNHQRKENWRAALLGPDYVDKLISNLLNRSGSNGLTLLSVDFSAFDASVGKNLQIKCFDYIKSMFQTSYNDDIDYIRHRFNTIGILTPDGVISGSHGVPSGATFTNEVDSLAQYLVASNSGFIPDNASFQIQGDDGVYLVKESDADGLMASFNKAGLKANSDKSGLAKDHCIYLQRLYDKFYGQYGLIGGIYSIYRALNRICYQERYSDFMDYSLKGVDYYAIRTITILENCKYHPCFKEFVKYIRNKDKYHLKFSADSLSKYNRMLNSGPGTAGLLNNQFGDNVKGINNFDTVKILRELA